jgi:two-component system, sensor histidine kinase and response regulator
MSGRPRLLYLDDEENNLFAFKALFRRDYEVFTTTSPQEAAAYLAEHEVPVIFSDQKMPGLSGVEFFELTVRDYPQATRVLITGYADIEAVINAINKGQVYRYVTKPWDENDLRVCVQNALERYATQRTLVENNRRLEEANAELEKFIYSVSHDLRAPLTSIKGVVNLARLEDIGPKASGFMEMIERSTNKLDQFLQNIIHYYQNLKVDEIRSEIDLNTLVDEVYEQYRYYEGAEFMSFRKDISQSRPFIADANRIKVILGNLVSNAIRFREPARENPEVVVRVNQTDRKTVIQVEDNGQGIQHSDLPNVFDMLYRSADKSLGTGIGLYIAREATRRLGGAISVVSERGKGSKFTLEIPDGV